MRFVTTRGTASPVSLKTALIEGLASDGLRRGHGTFATGDEHRCHDGCDDSAGTYLHRYSPGAKPDVRSTSRDTDLMSA